MYHQTKEIAIDAVLIDRFFIDGSIICLQEIFKDLLQNRTERGKNKSYNMKNKGQENEEGGE